MDPKKDPTRRCRAQAAWPAADQAAWARARAGADPLDDPGPAAHWAPETVHKTRRGLEGRVRQGRAGGSKAYGYRVVKAADAAGEPVRSGRCIDAAEAAVVRRIFTAFAAGQSPRAIARQLNQEGVPSPGGRPWGDTTIRGHATRQTGILRNALYVGRLVWNKQRYVKDPATGKRLARVRGLATTNIEAFNGRLRAECLNACWFLSMADAPNRSEEWRSRYNDDRPHMALGGLTPRAFATQAQSARQVA